MVGRLVAALAFLLVVAGTGFVHAHIPPTTRVDRGEAYVPRPAVAQVMAIGFDAVVADYYWLQAVQSIGGKETISPELGTQIGKLIDVVTTLDPWVSHPYRFAAVWLTESEENVRTANRLLERGIEHHPDDWRNYFYLGFNLFFQLHEYEAAADQLHIASELEGAPPYLGRLEARLRSRNGDIDVAEALLVQMIQDTDDEVLRSGYLAALDEIEIEKKARFLERAREAFNTIHGRDIMRVDELIGGPHPILSGLPSPEPDALPQGLRRGSTWELDLETDEIVSTYYGNRYRLHFASPERVRAERLAREQARRARGGDREPTAGLDEASAADSGEGASHGS